MTRRWWFLCALLCVVALGCNKDKNSNAEGGQAEKTAARRIAVIPKGTTHEFWKTVHAGAAKAATELGVEIIWKGPLKEDDLKSQIDLVQSFTAQGVSGITLAPLNDKALAPAVKTAKASGVPVVIFDSALAGKDYASFVATDNLAAGRLAGEQMAKLLKGKGKLVMLRYQEGSASTQAREQGFLDAVAKHPGLEVVSSNQYGGATTESAHSASENLLLAHKAAEGGIDGIFTPNESTTFGMLLALKKVGLAGKLKLVGFDSSEKLIQGVRDGHVDALVLQDPFRMGYLAVSTLNAQLDGKKVDARIDTGSRLVTKANMNQPDIAALLKPDLDKWLGDGG